MKTKLTVLLLFSGTVAFAQQRADTTKLRSDNDRMIVISGGGARGAWAVGFLQEHIKQKNIHYSAAFGTSTGSLMAPFILNNDTAKLRKGYTGVRQKDIFNVNPFKIKKNGDSVKSDIRFLNAVWRLVVGKKTLGESEHLKGRIKSFIDSSDYVRIKSQDLTLAVAVSNMSTGNVEIKSSNEYNYPDLCNWIWASANEPVWMSYYEKGGQYYVDGGVRDVIPLRQALDTAFKKKYTHLDVIINNSQNTLDPFPENNKKHFNWLASLVRVLGVYNQGTVDNDVTVGKYMEALHNLELECKDRTTNGDISQGIPLTITFYFMPFETAVKYRNELAFFPDMMEKLRLEGLKDGSESEKGKYHQVNKIEFNILNTVNTSSFLK